MKLEKPPPYFGMNSGTSSNSDPDVIMCGPSGAKRSEEGAREGNAHTPMMAVGIIGPDKLFAPGTQVERRLTARSRAVKKSRLVVEAQRCSALRRAEHHAIALMNDKYSAFCSEDMIVSDPMIPTANPGVRERHERAVLQTLCYTHAKKIP